MRKRYLIYLIGQRIRSKIEKICVEKKIADSAGEPNRKPAELARSDFWFELYSFARKSREPRTAVPPALRVPGSRSARGGRDQPAPANARRAAPPSGASRRDDPHCRWAHPKPTICPTGRASVRGGRGGMSTASASATDVCRVRPTEKYWTDYEDWKVRPPTRSRRLDTSVRPERTKKPAVSGAAVVLIILVPRFRETFLFYSPDRLTAFRALARFAHLRLSSFVTLPPFAQTTHHPSAVEHFESFKRMASGKLLVFLDMTGPSRRS